MSQAAEEGSHTLCKACGLCCRGVWFGFAPLQPEEVEPSRAAGFPVRVVNGNAELPLPCVFHRDNKCSVYDSWRPAVCGNYRCALLRNYSEGKTSLEEALGHVQAARSMADRVYAEAGDSAACIQGTWFLDSPAGGPGDAPRKAPDLSASARIEIVALRLYYSRYFNNKAPVAAP
jgi:Fe-S-cluster containining protein